MYSNYNPYYNNYNFSQMGNQFQQPIQQPIQQQLYRNSLTGLQGKQIDDLAVVKATDIPLDGSVSYFPLADNTAIATKQLMPDGTSKIMIYKPIDEKEEAQTPKYVTENELNDKIKDFSSKDIKDIKEDIKTLKRKIEDITDDIKDKKEK